MTADRVTETQKRFTKSIAKHEMKIELDDAPHRHLRFAKSAPSSWQYWFELVTWPGSLAINGDMGTFVFRRLPDMFEFFGTRGEIDYPYWAEKVQGGGKVREYSEERAKQIITEQFNEYREHLEDSDWQVIQEDIFDDPSVIGSDESVHRVLMELNLFSDTWEWDFHDYTHQFLWCCHAVRWGIIKYREET